MEITQNADILFVMSSALGRQVLWLLAIALGVYCLPIVWRSRSRLGIEDGDHIVASRLKGLACRAFC